MLGAIVALRGVQRIVRDQSARFDGEGDESPKGLEIPIGARILAACVLFQSHLPPVAELDAKSFASACDAVVSESGRALDPRIVEILVGRSFEEVRRSLGREATR
jgi:response regulator RpfG family c-di-GMP phosphodiesterase